MELKFQFHYLFQTKINLEKKGSYNDLQLRASKSVPNGYVLVVYLDFNSKNLSWLLKTSVATYYPSFITSL